MKGETPQWKDANIYIYIHPRKTNMEPKAEGLVHDDVPFRRDDFQVKDVNFPGCTPPKTDIDTQKIMVSNMGTNTFCRGPFEGVMLVFFFWGGGVSE